MQTAVRAGLVDLALQAVDGTKLAGNAAKDRTYDAKGLERLIERTEQAIADLEAQNATGGEGAPLRLPEGLVSKAALLERVWQAKEQLGPGERLNLTDREARLMKGRGGYVAGYNAQALVSPLDQTVAGQSGMREAWRDRRWADPGRRARGGGIPPSPGSLLGTSHSPF